MRPSVFWIAIAALCLGAVALQWTATADYGVGVSPDSVVYLDTARRVAAGEGWVYGSNMPGPGPDLEPVVLSHYPPGYPALLGGLTALGLRPENAARRAGAALLVANSLSVAAIAYRAFGPALAIGLTLSFAFGFPFQLHVMAWSEPLFLFFATWCVAGLSLAGSAPMRTRRSLAILGLVCVSGGAAGLSRYVGLSLAAVAALHVFFARGLGPPFKRAAAAAAALTAIATPPLLWLLWTARHGAHSSRDLTFHPVSAEALQGAVNAIAEFTTPLIPGIRREPLVFGPLWVVLLVALLGFGSRPKRLFSLGTPRSLPVLFAASYLAVVIAAMTLVDRLTPIDVRMLTPLLVAASFALAILITDVRPRAPRVGAALMVGCFGLLTLAGASSAWARFGKADRPGLLFARPAIAESETWTRLRARPMPAAPARPVISNCPELVYHYLQAGVLEVPCRSNPYTGGSAGDYQLQVWRLSTYLRAGADVVLCSQRPFHMPNREIEQMIGRPPDFVDDHSRLWLGRPAASR